MPRFRTTRRVRHSAGAMFDLVADIERYPDFVPLCQSLRIRRRTQNDEGAVVLVADMTVAYKLIRETFTSRVTLDRPRMRIMVEYVEGPFKFLENRWSFRSAPQGCEVEFFINYEFKSFALSLLMGSVFDRAFRHFSQAFEERADVIYGRAAA